MTLPGYRYGQSEAGRRIEAKGIKLAAVNRDLEMLKRGGALLRNLSDRLNNCREQIQAQITADQTRLDQASGMGHVHRILEETAQKYSISVRDILSDRRSKRFIPARREAMYRAVNETLFSLPAIGRMFRRDHTTIGHAVMRYAQDSGVEQPRDMHWAFKPRGRRKRSGV